MKPNTVTTVAAAVVACVALASVVALVIAAPENVDLANISTIVLGAAGTMLVTIVTLGRVEQTRSTVEDLANGTMDAKIRAGLADVLPPELLDPEYVKQLQDDRARRDASGHSGDRP